ncbi:MAG: hypothetical protein U9Q40_07310 [Campylobacterota bacterium]|nr:hypothetical protein [Campylobacterota bacterium]
MVKNLSITLGYILFFLLSLMYFTPKVTLFYLLEKELQKYDVVVSNEILVDNGFSLNVNDGSVFVKSIESAKIKEANIKIFGIYNSVNLNEIRLSNAAASFVPLYIDEFNVRYSIFNPLNVKAYAIGEFGEAEASFSILDMALHVDVEPSAKMQKEYKNSMRQLSKSEDGGYSYDKTF